MITVDVRGGLGNQMFQYATGKAIATRLGVGLQLDISFFGAYDLHGYGLDQWKGIVEPTVVGTDNHVFEEGMPYNADLQVTDGCTLHGCWQTEKYFVNIKPDLLNTFVPKHISGKAQEFAKQIRDAGEYSAFIHIRRTDYVNNPVLGVPLEGYYTEAIRFINSRVGSPKFFVFSDDPFWVREHFKACDFTLVSGHGTTNCEEIWLMSQCSHAIICNSTFSWWGAWLGEKPRPLRPTFSRRAPIPRVIVAPNTWFLSVYDSQHIVPSRWVKL